MVWWSRFDVSYINWFLRRAPQRLVSFVTSSEESKVALTRFVVQRVSGMQTDRMNQSWLNLAHSLRPKILTQLPNATRLTPIAVSFEEDNTSLFNLLNLIESGMNIAHVRISHLDDITSVITFDTLRKALAVCCERNHVEYWPLATGIALKSALCFTGYPHKEHCRGFHLQTGNEVILTNDLKYKSECNSEKIYVCYQNLKQDVTPDMIIFIDYGAVVLKCLRFSNENEISCTVLSGGPVSAKSVVIFRGAKYSVPNLAPIDYKLIELVKAEEIDVITVPYTRNARTIVEVRQALGEAKKCVKIFAGICEFQGLASIQEIIKEADGILLQKGTLALEMKDLRLILVLHYVIGLCVQAHKPILFSEHMMATCAECASVVDYTQALMAGVSGFMVVNSRGLYELTLRSVEDISSVCKAVEPVADLAALVWPIYDKIAFPCLPPEAMAAVAVLAARQSGVGAIMLNTASGRTARLVSGFLPHCPVLALTPSRSTARKLHVYRAVFPLLHTDACHNNWNVETFNRINVVLKFGLERGILSVGMVVLALFPSKPFSLFNDAFQFVEVTEALNASVCGVATRPARRPLSTSSL